MTSDQSVLPGWKLLSKSFQVPFEPVKKSDMVVTERPFIPPNQQSTGPTGLKQPSSAASKREVKKATQRVEVPGVVPANQSVETLGATLMTDQEVSTPTAASTRPEVQPPGHTAQPVALSTSLPGDAAPLRNRQRSQTRPVTRLQVLLMSVRSLI